MSGEPLVSGKKVVEESVVKASGIRGGGVFQDGLAKPPPTSQSIS